MKMNLLKTLLASFATLTTALATTEFQDMFSWGGDVTDRGSVTAGTSINGKKAQTQGGALTWTTSGTAVFSGTAGLWNGTLSMSGSSASLKFPLLARNSSSNNFTLLAEGVFQNGTSGTRGFYLGAQRADATGLLINQATDRVYGRIDQTGKVYLVQQKTGGSATTVSGDLSFLSGDTVRMELLIEPGTGAATLTVSGSSGGAPVVLQTTLAAPLNNLTMYAVNITGSSALSLRQAGVYDMSVQMPAKFPINMSFCAFGANHPLDLNDAANYAIHHAPSNFSDVKQQALINNRKNIVIRGASWPVGSLTSGLANLWPGYLLYYKGTKITQNVTASTGATTIYVEDSSCFRVTDPDVGPDHVIIYALNPDNTPNWGWFEYAKVTATGTGYITVTRATSGTTVKSFTAQNAVVAAHAACWITDEGEQQWILNFSLHAPIGPDGKRGWQWNSERVAANFLIPDTYGNIMDGVEHDVFGNNRNLCTRPMDCDNNLTPDCGYYNGINSFNLGIQQYTANLRRLIGPDKIIQFDSGSPRNGFRGWASVNGIQMESFMKGGTSSSAMEHLAHMSSDAQGTPRISYGLTKYFTNLGNVTEAEFRRNFAYGLMLGMPAPFKMDVVTGKFTGHFAWDEQCGGTLDDWTWLGQPLGAALRDMGNLSAQNLLDGNNAWTFNSGSGAGYTSGSTGQPADANGIRINVTATPTLPNITHGVDLYGLVNITKTATVAQEIGKEYTLIYEAKGDDSWITPDGEMIEDLPRLIDVTHFGGVGTCSALADREWRTYYMTYNATGDFQAKFGVGETTGNTTIRNIQLKKGTANRWSRDFENGKVWLNMSKTPWTVTLDRDYWRLKGPVEPDVNTGARLAANTTLAIPPEDAVYLTKHSPKFLDSFNYPVNQTLETVSANWIKSAGGSWIVANDLLDGEGNIDYSVKPPTGGPNITTAKTDVFKLLADQFLTMRVDYSAFAAPINKHGFVFNYVNNSNYYMVRIDGAVSPPVLSIAKKVSGTETPLATQTLGGTATGDGLFELSYNSATGQINVTLHRVEGSYTLSATDTSLNSGAVGVYGTAGTYHYRVCEFEARAKVSNP